jgi:uncharacterized protein
MNQPFKLFRLQQIDSQLDQARARLSEIERIISQDERLKVALEAEAQAADALKDASKALKRAEEEVRGQQIKIEQTEASLYGGRISNPKELQDLQKESASLKRYLQVLEDRQLDQMLVVEEAESRHQDSEAELNSIKTQVSSQHGVFLKEQEGLRKDVERLESERQAAASTIEENELQLYTQLRYQRKGIAVARVSDSSCTACGSTLTPSMVQSASSPSQLTRCSFCGRILYAG